MIQRRETRQIKVGDVAVGGGAPISVQTMTKTDTWNVDATVAQIRDVAEAGCDIVRLAVPQDKDAEALTAIVPQSPIPIIADIHFNYRLAQKALEAGVQGLRLNPGNIGGRDRVEIVTKAAAERGVPIRIGVNSGSIEKPLLEKVRSGQMRLAEAMCESALEHVRMLEELDFFDIKISLKATDVLTTVEAYRELAKVCSYPFHVGVTESGSLRTGTIKSSAGIGILLHDGLCDTIRVSLTADPKEEVFVGKQLLNSFGLLKNAATLISCPTCGRIQIDMQPIVKVVEDYLMREKIPVTVAVMGCAVNGPGEASEADIGVAGGKGVGLIFRRGEIVRKVAEADIVEALIAEIQSFKDELAAQRG
ncbi:flavodoxin-dependent (E)-4-hydroxy-3-methylbut-2-enyl-diphosphate synthase [Candidatus Sumerlaeota bacterium]|nr:flavodoxin-dependent (E)-4-hydroxy-3-methylbut-2-enyl-diphosphate synthase [Candidatus Sumerlaeota bacterium]